MGRHKKLPIPPRDIREYVKSTTDWRVILEELKALAIGGRKVQNYNGQEITSQPSIEALKLLMLFGWGRMGAVEKEDKTMEAIAKFTEFVKSVNTPSLASEQDESVDRSTNTDNENETLN